MPSWFKSMTFSHWEFSCMYTLNLISHAMAIAYFSFCAAFCVIALLFDIRSIKLKHEFAEILCMVAKAKTKKVVL